MALDPEASKQNLSNPEAKEVEVIEPGPISQWLNTQGIENAPIGSDHIGIENIAVNPNFLLKAASALKSNGFNYLQCQGGYDEGAGLSLVCFYHLIEIRDFKDDFHPREIRMKVFLDRNEEMRVPSLYQIFKGSDWQERETYDMFGINFAGHPHPKRLLMPEDWKGWPLRKDYVQPDFYEMQDAY
ncbi:MULTISPECIES: NAD(P)H-quinone oxidoreductase subunit J [Prochlorococcus]|uniref:NAD(P)H-quinone oxidoreductase subunit J n=1 Tax=Prochlorococcus TaxID=1218 RepID=UPI00053380E3|nr:MULTISPECIES: NAD(P)H-quinone oxidoreductase subunit J [Prochlorococcus]KGG13072.1 NAD(P)H-quinone oxidoreductase chain J [Prochlorococcus sp. MIT 0601]